MKTIIIGLCLLVYIIMTIKQILGLFIVLVVVGYHNYETTQENPTPPVVVPNVAPKIIPDYKPQNEVEVFFTKADQYRKINERTIYADVLSHSIQEPYGDQDGRRINVHETSHGITSDLRKSFSQALNKKINVFYVLNSKCIVLEESNISMRLVTNYIPNILRSYRYNLYFIEGLQDWNDMPSYILDEWNAYILAGMSAVEDHNNGILNKRVDAVSGCLDFSIYSICFAMAVKDNDLDYWNTYPQFKNTIKFLAKRAEITFKKGMEIKNFKTQSQYTLYKNLLYHPDAGKIREFITKELDQVFIKENILQAID